MQLLVVGASFFPYILLPSIRTLLPFSLFPFEPPPRIIYSHFLAIKIELCCRIFACSALLQRWWIILHPANWKASHSFMSALCWFTIKTYCTVLWVQAWLCRELINRKNWGWSRSSWFGGHSAYAVCMCVCVIFSVLYFIFMTQKPFICVNCLLSRYFGSLYMLLCILGVLPLQLDSHSVMFFPFWHTLLSWKSSDCVWSVSGVATESVPSKKEKKKKKWKESYPNLAFLFGRKKTCNFY